MLIHACAALVLLPATTLAVPPAPQTYVTGQRTKETVQWLVENKMAQEVEDGIVLENNVEMVQKRVELVSEDVFFSDPDFNQWRTQGQKKTDRPLVIINESQAFNAAVFGFPINSSLVKLFEVLFGLESSGDSWLGWLRDENNTDWTVSALASLLPTGGSPPNNFLVRKVKTDLKLYVEKLAGISKWAGNGFSREEETVRKYFSIGRELFNTDYPELEGYLPPQEEMLRELESVLKQGSGLQLFDQALEKLANFRVKFEQTFDNKEERAKYTTLQQWKNFVTPLVDGDNWDKLGGLNMRETEGKFPVLLNFGGAEAASVLSGVHKVLHDFKEPVDVWVQNSERKTAPPESGPRWVAKSLSGFAFEGCTTDVVNFFALVVHAYENKKEQDGGQDLGYETSSDAQTRIQPSFGKLEEKQTSQVIERYSEMFFRLGKVVNQLKDIADHAGPKSLSEKEGAVLYSAIEELRKLHEFFGAVNIQHLLLDMESDDTIALVFSVIIPKMFNGAVKVARRLARFRVLQEELPTLTHATLQLPDSKEQDFAEHLQKRIVGFVREVLGGEGIDVQSRIDEQSLNGKNVSKHWETVLQKLEPVSSGEPVAVRGSSSYLREAQPHAQPAVPEARPGWYVRFLQVRPDRLVYGYPPLHLSSS